jgi:hypothetical protein
MCNAREMHVVDFSTFSTSQSEIRIDVGPWLVSFATMFLIEVFQATWKKVLRLLLKTKASLSSLSRTLKERMSPQQKSIKILPKTQKLSNIELFSLAKCFFQSLFLCKCSGCSDDFTLHVLNLNSNTFQPLRRQEQCRGNDFSRIPKFIPCATFNLTLSNLLRGRYNIQRRAIKNLCPFWFLIRTHENVNNFNEGLPRAVVECVNIDAESHPVFLSHKYRNQHNVVPMNTGQEIFIANIFVRWETKRRMILMAIKRTGDY